MLAEKIRLAVDFFQQPVSVHLAFSLSNIILSTRKRRLITTRVS